MRSKLLVSATVANALALSACLVVTMAGCVEEDGFSIDEKASRKPSQPVRSQSDGAPAIDGSDEADSAGETDAAEEPTGDNDAEAEPDTNEEPDADIAGGEDGAVSDPTDAEVDAGATDSGPAPVDGGPARDGGADASDGSSIRDARADVGSGGPTDGGRDASRDAAESGGNDSGSDGSTAFDAGFDATVDSAIDAATDSGSSDPDAGRAPGWYFDENLEGWEVKKGSPDRLRFETEAQHDPFTGSPTPGSVSLAIPFSSGSQHIEFVLASPPLDLTGKIVHIKIRLDSGLRSDEPYGRVKLFLKSGASYFYAAGTSSALVATDGWIDVAVNADAPTGFVTTGYSPDVIREIGIEIASGPAGSTAAPAILHVDSVSIE